MKTERLPPQEQIDLLNNIKSSIIRATWPFNRFLCNAYYIHSYGENALFIDSYNRTSRWVYRQRVFRKQVPLFTFANAKRFGANHKSENAGGWFKYGKIQERLNFLDWIIEENQKIIDSELK